MIGIKTRFTDVEPWFQPASVNCHRFSWTYAKLTEFISRYGNIEKCTYGYEMEAERPHCHVHFLITAKKPLPKTSLSQTFIYYVKKDIKTKLVNKSYSFVVEQDIVDEVAFMQYPLKEEQTDTSLCKGYTKQQLSNMHSAAAQVLQMKIKHEYDKKQKAKSEKSEKHRLKVYIEGKVNSYYDDFQLQFEAVYLAIVQYCMDEKDFVVYRDVDSKVWTFLLETGRITPFQYMENNSRYLGK